MMLLMFVSSICFSTVLKMGRPYFKCVHTLCVPSTYYYYSSRSISSSSVPYPLLLCVYIEHFLWLMILSIREVLVVSVLCEAYGRLLTQMWTRTYKWAFKLASWPKYGGVKKKALLFVVKSLNSHCSEM